MRRIEQGSVKIGKFVVAVCRLAEHGVPSAVGHGKVRSDLELILSEELKLIGLNYRRQVHRVLAEIGSAAQQEVGPGALKTDVAGNGLPGRIHRKNSLVTVGRVLVLLIMIESSAGLDGVFVPYLGHGGKHAVIGVQIAIRRGGAKTCWSASERDGRASIEGPRSSWTSTRRISRGSRP